jgi:Transposase DDE domain
MADTTCALGRLRRTQGFDLLPDQPVVQLLKALGIVWRQRLLTPLVTLRLFVLQILHGNTSITHLRQLSGLDFAAASYCEARGKLPIRLLLQLLNWIAQQAARLQPQACLGNRVLIADGFNFSMPDTPALRQRFGLPKAFGVKTGVSYPAAKAIALLDFATGCFLRLIPGPLYRHDAHGVVRLHRHLRSGDILVGDRAFCSMVHLALLSMRGVYGCFRLHQRRHSIASGIERWKRSLRPRWMTAAQFDALPSSLDVRIVRYKTRRRGFRTQEIAIATTLLDSAAWPDQSIAQLYGHRWNIETCFNHLKTTMKMNVLKCRSTASIYRELLMYLVVYNLVRLAMLSRAMIQQVEVYRISFVDAMRYMAAVLLGLRGVERLLINPRRPGRHQPRLIRRRPKGYDLMMKPRAAYASRVNTDETH